jgi:hypothetical protein
MKGSLKIESTPNVGTNVRFTVCFGKVSDENAFFEIDRYAVNRAPGALP